MVTSAPGKPLVSVIIPSYNREKLLPRAIESVLQQSYPNIEIVVIDDGSTDNTKVSLEPFEGKIRYLFTDHKGTAHARNQGMKAASGKYLSFLDSDDTYLPFKIEIQVAFIEEHPEVGMVYTEFSGAYADGYVEDYHLQSYHLMYAEQGWRYENMFTVYGEFNYNFIDRPVSYYIGDIFKYDLIGGVIPTNTILFPKEILEVVGYQNENYRLLQEYEFVVRICKHYQVAFLNIPSYVLYYHTEQSSNLIEKKRLHDRESILHNVNFSKVHLNAVMDWAYNDEAYYAKNSAWIDLRLAQLNGQIALQWLEYGDREKSRQCLTNCLRLSPKSRKYKFYSLLTYLPYFTRATAVRMTQFIEGWMVRLFNRRHRKRLFKKWARRFFGTPSNDCATTNSNVIGK